MSRLPAQPVIYEIDTWVWLDDLSRRLRREVTLSDVPGEVWDAVAMPGFDAVWFMGVWKRSAAGTRVALENAAFQESFADALPGFTNEDVVGSPYCVAGYQVDERFGGETGLAHAREELARRGLGMVLDFVPNHVASDHPWITEHPEYFVQTPDASNADISAFATIGERAFALGRDPYFPPWPDVIQLNAFNAGLRAASTQTLKDISRLCDGVRCDMAMLFVNEVFERTWGSLVGPSPDNEYWPDVITSVREHSPGFAFIAEAYWDMENVLIQQGFDFAYDKRLYDRLLHEDAESVRAHLRADVTYQQHLLRFLENHDEARAASAFTPERERAAAVLNAVLPGAKLYHEGQYEGRRVHNSVLLGRRIDEQPDVDLQRFFQHLVAVAGRIKPSSDWKVATTNGWPDNDSHRHLIASTWTSDGERYMSIVNFSASPAQGRAQLPWNDFGDRKWLLSDQLADIQYKRDGRELQGEGLFVELGPWQSHVFHVTN